MNNEVVKIGPHTLYRGDCLEVLPHIGAVDIAVTSPPYNIRGGTHGASGMFSNERCGPRKISGEWYADAMPEDEYWAWINCVIEACRTAARGLIWVNHKVRFEDREAIHPVQKIKQPCYSEVIWDRGGSITLNAKKFAPSHEGIWGFGTPHFWENSSNTMMSVWRIAPQVSDDHPCPFPVEIPKRLIEASCPVDGIVLDPFAGIASTGIACVRTQRRFVGCELDAKYFDIACRRIEKAMSDDALPLFGEKPAQLQFGEAVR